MPEAIRLSLIVVDSTVCAAASKLLLVNANVFHVVALTPGCRLSSQGTPTSSPQRHRDLQYGTDTDSAGRASRILCPDQSRRVCEVQVDKRLHHIQPAFSKCHRES